MSSRVSLVIPVRESATAKTRLTEGRDSATDARRALLAAAIALDTVAAARAAREVGELIVVGALAEPIEGVTVLDDPGLGLLAAIGAGLSVVDSTLPTAVLLGDLPALQPAELDAALIEAHQYPRAFVADAEGDGTTLVTAAAGQTHALRFGQGSAQGHRDAGYVNLLLPDHSGLRRDVDTPQQLAALAALAADGSVRLGARTAALLGPAPRLSS